MSMTDFTILPSLEPLAVAVRAALMADLQAALDHVATRYPEPRLDLRAPEDADGYRIASVRSFGMTDRLPLVTVTGRDLREVGDRSRQWEGTIEVVAWLPDYGAAGAVYATWRWGAALWLALIHNSPFETTNGEIKILPHTVEYGQAEDETETQHRRAVGLRFQSQFRA